VQELTHHGATEAAMRQVAALIADVILARRPIELVANDVHVFVEQLGPVQYTW
jgi:glycine/serine hydroxymethyltransferase